MFAFLAAIVFAVELVFDPRADVNLVTLGLLLIALHLAIGEVVVSAWRGRNRISR